MSEENTQITEEVINGGGESGRELSSFELKMQSHGWDPKGTLSAEDWIDNGFKIKNKKLDNLFEAVDTLKSKFIETEISAYDRAKRDLEEERLEAIRSADVDAVRDVESRQAKLADPRVNTLVNDFKTRHSKWINGVTYEEQQMQMDCDARDKAIMAENLSPDQHFAKLDAYMKGKYPSYFNEPVIEVKQPVIHSDAGATVGKTSRKKTFADLDDVQQRAAKNLAAQGVMSLDEYVAFVFKK